MKTVYKYTTRSAEGSGKLLIEFTDLPRDKEFIKQLIRALKPLNVQVVNYDDLWINEEIALNASSDIGPIAICRDKHGYYFIAANDNQDAIMLLDAMLSKNPLYIKA